jgi:hypothetical protein
MESLITLKFVSAAYLVGFELFQILKPKAKTGVVEQ